MRTPADTIAEHERALAALRCLRRSNLIKNRGTTTKPFWMPLDQSDRFGWVTLAKLTTRGLAQTVGTGIGKEIEITPAGSACLDEIERRRLA